MLNLGDYKVYVYIIYVFSHLAVRLPQISRCVFALRLRFRINIPHAAWQLIIIVVYTSRLPLELSAGLDQSAFVW